MALLASPSAYPSASSIVTLLASFLLLFCVAVLLDAGVVFVRFFVGFFVGGVLVVVEFFVGIFVEIFRSSLY